MTPGSGGTLNTTGGDGTKYTLKVPAGAVLSPVTVTMTPLSSVGGLGMSGGLVGGVVCALVIVAGPTDPLLPREVDAINAYTHATGRLLVLATSLSTADPNPLQKSSK